MEKWTQRAIRLLTALVFAEEQDPRVTAPRAEKSVLCNQDPAWNVRVSPEQEGVLPEDICQFLDTLEKEPRSHLQNLIILRNGRILCECSRPGYDCRMPHLSHSMSKTVTGMAIGLLMDEGILNEDDLVLSFFPEIIKSDPLFSSLTVRHLLMMESGAGFNEAGSVSEDNWTRAFFETPAKFAPGDAFSYNSMNTYILSCIVTRIAGKPLDEFAGERIFAPLGICEWLWEKSPEGIVKGGWGLYLSCEAWAKLGVMAANGGIYRGKRILSEAFVHAASSVQSTHSLEKDGNYAYGYQMWTDKRGNGDFLFNGMLGQNVLVSPRTGMVIALNSSNNELFQASPTLDAARELIDRISLVRKKIMYDRKASQRLAWKTEHFFEKRTGVTILPKEKKSFSLTAFLSSLFHPQRKEATPSAFAPLLGKTLLLRENNAAVLPLFVRLMSNNFGGGIQSIRLEESGGELLLTVTEDGKEIRLPVGEGSYRMSSMEVRGERYRIGVAGEAGTNASGEKIFKIEFVFPELPNTHLWTFTEENGYFRLFGTEEPNQRVAEDYLSVIREGKSGFSRIFELLEEKYGSNFVMNKIQAVFQSEILCIPEEWENCAEILREENEKHQKACRFGKRILNVIDRVFGMDGQGIFSYVLSGMKSGIGSIFGLFGKEKAAEPAEILKEELISILPEEDQIESP